MKEKAIQFGKALDQDDFATAESLLSEDCHYYIGEETLIGPKAICDSYEQNMLEGRQKLDELVWGNAEIEVVSDLEYIVHFTDYLTHKNQKHTHRCEQQLTFNTQGKIISIHHINNQKEQIALHDFYVKVGLK